jgi:LacI family transcriptional regulator
VPLVLASRRIYGLDVDVVLLDDVGGAYRGTLALLDAGHTRIGYLGNVSSAFTGGRRYEGYLRALDERGIQPDPEIVLREQLDGGSASDATRRLLDLPEPPTAIFSANNRNSVGALREIGRRLRAGAQPAEMPSLVSFDDFELAELMPVPVTVVDHDPRQLGREAAGLLLSRLGDKAGRSGPARVVEMPVRVTSAAVSG